MKKIYNLILPALLACTVIPGSLVSCSDVGGDGIDSVLWEGSENPENISFRNPVWEPSLEAGTVYKGASLYVAVSSETQWSAGINYRLPSITSTDLMRWTFSQQTAFMSDTAAVSVDKDGNKTYDYTGVMPLWTENRITSISADFAKTVSGTPYWMLYQPEGENAIGVAYSTSQQGPFTDLGALLKAEDLGVESLFDPFIVVFSTKFYMLYSTENGAYIQELGLKKASMPTLKGSPVQVAGPDFADVALYRTDNKHYYLFGTVANGDKTEIRYAFCESATGKYTDKNGLGLLEGSNGELLIQGNDTNINPENVSRVFENGDGIQFIAYNATNVGNETMVSGFARRPLFITPCELDENGWFKDVVTPTTGWTTPRFK